MIKNSTISISADIKETALILNSKIGELCMIGENTRFCYSHLGDYSYIGDNSHVFSTDIGKFSSISWNVTLGPGNHDFKRLTSHAMLYANRFKMIQEPIYNQYDKECIIGNDVWIGCNATIFRGVKIGDGAIIGANSIIKKDVSPFSIVGGIDKKLGIRFDDEIISKILEIKWWNYPPEKIKSCMELIAQYPTMKILEKLKELLNS